MSFRTVQLNISHSLHIIQFWVSLPIPSYCRKRLLWWGPRETLIYEDRRMQILHRFKSEKVPALREGSEHRVPLLTKKTVFSWYLLAKKKNPCFAIECHWIQYSTNVTKQMTSMVFLWTFVSLWFHLNFFCLTDLYLLWFSFCGIFCLLFAVFS